MGHWACKCASQTMTKLMKRQRRAVTSHWSLRINCWLQNHLEEPRFTQPYALLTIRRLRCYIKIKTVSSMVFRPLIMGSSLLEVEPTKSSPDIFPSKA